MIKESKNVGCASAAYQHLFIALSAILFFFFTVAAGKDAYDQVQLPPPAVAAAAALKVPEVAMQPRLGLQLDSARLSPVDSAQQLDKKADSKGTILPDTPFRV